MVNLDKRYKMALLRDSDDVVSFILRKLHQTNYEILCATYPNYHIANVLSLWIQNF